MRRSFTLLVAACGLFTACGSPPTPEGPQTVANPEWGTWQNAETVPFRFVLEQRFDGADAAIDPPIGGLGWLGVDDEDNVYSYDYQASRVVSFGPDGTLRWVTAGAGSGPGELNQPQAMAVRGDGTVAVSNENGTSVSLFDRNGRFVESCSTQDLGARQARIVGFLGDGAAVFGTFLPDRFGVRYLVANPCSGSPPVADFEIDQSRGGAPEASSSGQPYMGVAGDLIFATNLETYSIDVRDGTGARQRLVTRDFDQLVPAYIHEMSGFKGVRYFSALVAPLALDSGRWLVQANWPTNLESPAAYMELARQGKAPQLTSERTLDFYDADWRLLYSLDGDAAREFGLRHVFTTDTRGRVYAMLADTTQAVGRFRVEVSPPR